jgi:type II secretory pathway predicted ATPase ExeA
MAYAFMRAEGFVMVTGQPGTGKTTLVGDLIESLSDENVTVANLVSTQLAADDLLRMVAFSFDLDTQGLDKAEILQKLTRLLSDMYRSARRALLIVDEAQDLGPNALEELRLLTNLQRDGKPLLQIFLLGQPELREMVHRPELVNLHQRIVAASHLEPLKEDETRDYVEHRLRQVGWKGIPAISTAVYPVIFLYSEGVPRRINQICSRLLLHAAVEQQKQIGIAIARTVVEELQDEQLSTKNLLHHPMFKEEDEFPELEFDTSESNTEPQDEIANHEAPPEIGTNITTEEDLPPNVLHDTPVSHEANEERKDEHLAPEIVEALNDALDYAQSTDTEEQKTGETKQANDRSNIPFEIVDDTPESSRSNLLRMSSLGLLLCVLFSFWLLPDVKKQEYCEAIHKQYLRMASVIEGMLD